MWCCCPQDSEIEYVHNLVKQYDEWSDFNMRKNRERRHALLRLKQRGKLAEDAQIDYIVEIARPSCVSSTEVL